MLDRARPGGGTTGRGAGLVLTGIADHASRLAHGVGRDEAAAVWRFTLESGEIVADLVNRRRIACGYERTGSYALAANPAEDQDLEETVALLVEEDVDAGAAYLDEAALAREPRAPQAIGAIRYGRDAVLDGAAFLRGLAAALPPGATLREGAEVRALHPSERGVAVEVGDAGAVEAEVAIVAANARAAEVAPFFDGLVWPVRGQGFVTAPLPRLLDRPATAGWGHETYRQLPDGRVVAAGFRPEPGADDMGHDERPTDVFQGFLARLAAQRIRGFPADPPVERRFAGPCGFSKDALPLLGPLPGEPRLLAACGYTMRGLSLGAAAGRGVARLVLGAGREFPACFLPARLV